LKKNILTNSTKRRVEKLIFLLKCAQVIKPKTPKVRVVG